MRDRKRHCEKSNYGCRRFPVAGAVFASRVGAALSRKGCSRRAVAFSPSSGIKLARRSPLSFYRAAFLPTRRLRNALRNYKNKRPVRPSSRHPTKSLAVKVQTRESRWVVDGDNLAIRAVATVSRIVLVHVGV